VYQKLAIREADAHVRVLDSRDDVIRPDRTIICSDWPTTLRCSSTFGYKRRTRAGRDRDRERERESKRVTDRK